MRETQREREQEREIWGLEVPWPGSLPSCSSRRYVLSAPSGVGHDVAPNELVRTTKNTLPEECTQASLVSSPSGCLSHCLSTQTDTDTNMKQVPLRRLCR